MNTRPVCGAAVLLVAAIACGGGPMSPADVEDKLPERLETASIVFRFARGDSVDADWQQRYHDWITSLLSVQLPTKLKYYKYAGRAQIRDAVGFETNGFAEPSVYTVHSIFPHDGHEAAHVYTALVGRPSNFFNEGIAVALNTEPGVPVWTSEWNGTHVYAHTQLLIRTQQLRPLAPMLTTSAFNNVDQWIGYGEAGSFLLFLIEQYGIDRMVTFFGMSAQNDSLARIEANIRSVWGLSLAEAEAAWLEFIDGWTG